MAHASPSDYRLSAARRASGRRVALLRENRWQVGHDSVAGTPTDEVLTCG